MRITDFINGMEVAVTGQNSESVNLTGFIGKVIGVEEERGLVCVRFEEVPENLREELHTCKRRCEYGHGWMFQPEYLVPLEDREWDFERADPGDKCDFSGGQADFKAGKLRFRKIYAGIVTKCSQCGEYHYIKDLHKGADGELYCNECVAENGWKVCADCGEVLADSGQWIYVNRDLDDEKIVCPSCIDSENYFRCADCNKFFTNMHKKFTDNDVSICENCASEWATCEECGSLVHREENNLFCGDYYCPRHNPANVPVHNYSFKPSPIFYGDGDLYMGVELEIDRGDDPDGVAIAIRRPQLYCKRDGSLGSYGVEIVTHPCTLEYHTNQFDWKSIIRSALERDYESHNAGTCGLHVHVNRTFFGEDTAEQELNISKVVMLVQRFWDELVKFSRRRSGDIEEWAKKPTADFQKGDDAADARRKIRCEARDCDRYYAVNLQNAATIEFRLFRGTLKLRTLLATLQFVDGICRYACAHDIDEVYDVSWSEFIGDPLFEYDELREYLEERGL